MPVPLLKLMMLSSAFCAGAAVLSDAVAEGKVYRWTDESGQTVYSDQPPPSGRSAEQLQMPAGPSPADVEAARQRSEAMQRQADQLAEERRQREQRAADAAQKAAASQAGKDAAEEPSQNPYFDAGPFYPDRQPVFRPRPPHGNIPARPTHPIVRPGVPRR